MYVPAKRVSQPKRPSATARLPIRLAVTSPASPSVLPTWVPVLGPLPPLARRTW